MKSVGSKAEVWHSTAEHTSGGLHKSDLMKNKGGRIVSIKKHKQGVEAFKRNGMKPKTAAELDAMRPNRKTKSEAPVIDQVPLPA